MKIILNQQEMMKLIKKSYPREMIPEYEVKEVSEVTITTLPKEEVENEQT